MFYIDGTRYGVPCSVQRETEVRSSEVSGQLMDGTYFNDVLGTYLTYDVTVAVPPSMEYLYTEIYEILTEPVDSHVFVLPYNQTTISVNGRIESVSDNLVYTASAKQYWRGMTFSIVSSKPIKSADPNGVVLRGMSSLPDAYQVEVGTQYVATANGWSLVS